MLKPVRLRLGRSGNRILSVLEDLVDPHKTDLARFPFSCILALLKKLSKRKKISFTSGALFMIFSSFFFLSHKIISTKEIPSFPVDKVCRRNLSHQFENSHQYEFSHICKEKITNIAFWENDKNTFFLIIWTLI